ATDQAQRKSMDQGNIFPVHLKGQQGFILHRFGNGYAPGNHFLGRITTQVLVDRMITNINGIAFYPYRFQDITESNSRPGRTIYRSDIPLVALGGRIELLPAIPATFERKLV